MSVAETLDPVGLSRTLGTRLAFERRPGEEKARTDAILQQMRADQLMWCLAPSEIGGLGASVADAARITFNIARLSGSAGLIYAMHLSQALSLLRHGGDVAFFEAFRRRLIADQALVASGTSEKGVGGDIFGSICTIEEAAGGGLSVTKESPNISYMDHARAVLVSAMRLEPDGRKSQVLIAADVEAMELQPGRTAGFIGMRGIHNSPYLLTARFSPQAIFAEKYPVIARDTMTPSIHIFWAALWSGIACDVLDRVKAYIAQEVKEEDVAPVMRYELSRLVDQHHTMNALIRDAVRDFEAQGDAAGGGMNLAGTARVKRLKTACSELLAEICHDALGLIGMRGYAEEGRYSLSEQLRDAMSARVMISNYRLLTNNAKVERYIEERL